MPRDSRAVSDVSIGSVGSFMDQYSSENFTFTPEQEAAARKIVIAQYQELLKADVNERSKDLGLFKKDDIDYGVVDLRAQLMDSELKLVFNQIMIAQLLFDTPDRDYIDLRIKEFEQLFEEKSGIKPRSISRTFLNFRCNEEASLNEYITKATLEFSYHQHTAGSFLTSPAGLEAMEALTEQCSQIKGSPINEMLVSYCNEEVNSHLMRSLLLKAQGETKTTMGFGGKSLSFEGTNYNIPTHLKNALSKVLSDSSNLSLEGYKFKQLIKDTLRAEDFGTNKGRSAWTQKLYDQSSEIASMPLLQSVIRSSQRVQDQNPDVSSSPDFSR